MTLPDPAARTHFFRELDGDRTGLVHIHDSFVRRCDFAFDAPLERPDSLSAHVVLDDGRVLSLHQNQPVSARDVETWPSGRRVSRAEVLSHLALTGSDPWRADEPVGHVSFCCPDANHLFAHVEKQRRIVQAESFSKGDMWLFHVAVGGETYGADHVVNRNRDNPVPIIGDIRFWIEFPDGCPIGAIRQRLTGYTSFLSFIANRRVTLRSVRMGKVLSADDVQPEHQVVLSWPSTGPQAEPCPVRNAPFAAGDDDDLAALADGLSCWIGRMDGWQDAYVRMMACLGSTEEMFSERILTAWRWFERLPDTEERKVLDPLTIKPLADAAFAVAQEQGLDISRKRIDGSLRALCKESFEQRIRRLVASAMRGTDIGGIWTEMTRDISAGREIRGAAAHGNTAKPGQQEAVQRALSASATEAFCFLFTARDLPLTPARRERLKHHPLVTDYTRLLAANRPPSP